MKIFHFYEHLDEQTISLNFPESGYFLYVENYNGVFECLKKCLHAFLSLYSKKKLVLQLERR